MLRGAFLDKIKEFMYCYFSGDIPGCVVRFMRPRFLNEGISVNYYKVTSNG